MQELTLEQALQIVSQALDSVQTDGPQRRLIDKAFLTVKETVEAKPGEGSQDHS